MADIAQLGFAVDTGPLNDASTSLQKLVPASAAAAAGADSVATALGGASAAAVAVSNAAKGTTTQTTAVAKVAAVAAGSVNQLSTANTNNANATKVAAGATNNLVTAHAGLSVTSQTAVTQQGTLSKIWQAATGWISSLTGATKTNATAANTSTAATNNLAHAHAGLSTQAMAAQHSIRSMVEGLASGMPISNVLTQQLNHLSYAASGPGGITKAFGDAFGMFTKLISVSTLVIVGIVAVAIAFGVLALNAIKSELALNDLSAATNTTMTEIRGLQQAANFKGVNTDDLTKAITAIAQGVSDAGHNMGGLVELFRANNVQIKGNVASLETVADLVAATSDGIQKRNILQAAGLPTTMAFVKFMSQGGTAIQAAIDSTGKFNVAAEANLVKKAQDFEDAWNKATTNTDAFFHKIVVNAVLGINSLQQSILTFTAIAGVAIAVMLAPFTLIGAAFAAIVAGGAALARIGGLGQTNTGGGVRDDGTPIARVLITKPNAPAPTGPPPLTHDQAVKQNSDAQARISILGDLATVQQQATAKQIELNTATLNGVGVSAQMQAKIVLGVTAQAEQNRVNQQATMGIFSIQSAQQAASDTLQHWIDQGLVDKNNTEQMAAAHLVLARNIKATSDAAQVAAAPFQQLKQLELDGANLSKSFDTAMTGALNNLVQPIQDMMNGVTGLSAGFKNLGVVVLQAIQQMIIKMLILTPIAKALQSVFGGMFGFSLGGVPGAVGPTSLGGAPLVPNARGGVYNSPSLSAYSGTVVSQPSLFRFASGAGLMGEAGPEGILPLKRGPSGSLGVQMYGSNQSSSNDNSQPIQFNHSPTYVLGGGVTQDDLAQVKKAQAKSEREFTANVAKAIPELRKRNVRV